MADLNYAIYKIEEKGILASYFTEGYVNDIVEALEKQIPKKPTRPDCYALHCPTCNNIVFDFNVERQDYCSKCGQAIDWSE